MKPRFKIGDEIFFMNYDTPAKGVIKGISFIFGTFETISFSRKNKDDNPTITYCTGTYTIVDDDKAFATKEELKNSVFSKL